MANVLPQEAQKNVWWLRRARFILVASFALMLSSLVAFLSLLPAYVVLVSAAPAQERAAVMAQSPEREEITRAQALVRELMPASSTPQSLEVVDSVLAARPVGVAVRAIVYTRADAPSGESELTLEGIASSREGINAYRSLLSADQRFKSVTVPLRDLSGTEDGHFTVTITGTF